MIFLQSSIDVSGNNRDDGGENGGNKTNLSNSSTSKMFIGTGYLTFQGAKKGGGNPNSNSGNIKKSVKAAKGSNYLTPSAKKTFNLLQHAFIQAPIFQHFNPE